MAKFVVGVKEVHIQLVEIDDVENAEEALEIVREGGGNTLDDSLDYSHTLDSDTWTINEVK